MSFVVKKRDLTDPAQLQALIVEHADDLERGLTILDSRLLLGQASIDIVALDAEGALVLIAVGLVADEEMFLKAVDAYSWCLEYPDAIHRLYPTVQFSAAHPPRVMFVVERMPDAFHRKIKQLGFAAVDCVEFRHLDVDGTPAMYFDSLARLRRAVVPPPVAPEQNGASTTPVAHGRATSLKLQRLLGADRSVAGREPAPVVRMVHRTPPPPEPKPAASAPRTERVVPPKPVDEPVTARSSVETPAPSAVRAAVTKPSRKPGRSLDVAPVAGVIEAVASAPELLAHGVETVEAMIEPFVVGPPPTQNGRVDSLPVTVRKPEPEKARAAAILPDAPTTPIVRERVAAEPFTPAAEPVAPTPPMVDDAAVRVTSAPAPESMAVTITAPEPQLVVRDVLELESRPVIDTPPDSDPLAATLASPIVTEPEPAGADLSIEPLHSIVTEPEPAVVELTIESLQPIVTEPEPAVAELSLEPVHSIVAEPEPAVAELSLEPLHLIVTEPQPAAAELSVEPLHLIVTEPQPVVAPLSLETLQPIVSEPEPVVTEPARAPAAPPTAPASVFSRRLPEPAPLTRAEMKVSFAGVAKDLLAHANPTPEMEPPVSIPRPSVEEITRAALDELVGATEKRGTEDRSTAFAKPSGAFSKSPTQRRPRTIAPPQADGELIAGGAKLGTAARRNGPPVTGTDSAPPGTETEAAQPLPEGFEGLQFPNDGVLTRQWMEFLNQMAAGK
jgi:hypothetical protein